MPERQTTLECPETAATERGTRASLQATYLLATFLLVGGGALVLLAMLAWRQRDAPSAKELVWLLTAAAIWVLSAAAEHLLPTQVGKILASKIQYVGILSLPLASLATVLAATNQYRWLRRRLKYLLAVAGVGWLAVATNE